MRVAFARAVALMSGFGAYAFMRWLPSATRGRSAPQPHGLTAYLHRRVA
jgi:hypothetical protein